VFSGATVNSEGYEARESRHDIGTQTGFLPSSRYSRPPSSIYRFHLGHISASSPLYALSFISCAFHNPTLLAVLLACELAVLTPVQSVSSTRCDSNGRLDTFSFPTPFGHIRPGYVYRILTSESSVHPVGVKGLASWRRTVVQSAQRKNPSFFWVERPERRRKMRKRERERIEGLRRRDWQPLCARGLADNVAAANIAYCPSSMAVCPAPLSLMISERLACARICERISAMLESLRYNKPISRCWSIHAACITSTRAAA